ncbi:hypothetical protein MHU86_4125 [Fragilaria crotonensis]|nr:hypothetical protein MHU86_4125 [Fragilaria crotonensis]
MMLVHNFQGQRKPCPPQQNTAHAEDSVHGVAAVEAGAGGAATLLEIDMYKVGVKDSAVVKLDKKSKRGPPSGAKERTDEAILKFINQQLLEDKNDASEKETTSAAGAVTSSAKEEYIREKKRIAVRADDVAMAREVSDAVDLSLQKWKAALKDLQDMKAGGIPANHPIFIATKATADLHESAFNTCLAKATKRQEEEGLAVSGVQVLSAMGDANSVTHATPAFSNIVVYHTPPARSTETC